VRLFGRGKLIEGLAQISSLSLRESRGGRLVLGRVLGPSCETRFRIGEPTSARGAWVGGTDGCPKGTHPRPLGWGFGIIILTCFGC